MTITCTTNTYTIGGTVSGLAGTGLVLQDNSGDNLTVSANGAFTFATSVASGGTYNVTVSTEPSSPTQACAVTMGAGSVTNANVTGVTVTCTTSTFAVGGSVSGLVGSGLVLQDNNGDNLSIPGNGTFTFPTQVASGAMYSATVLTNPSTPSQTCLVSAGSGTVVSTAVNTITVTCTTNSYTVGGTVTGLAGSGLVLQDNSGDNLPVSMNGAFTFATSVPSGGAFNVTVFSNPASPTQSCTVNGGTGNVVAGNVTSVTINCSTTTFTVGGTVSGLAGTGLVLQDNGGDNLTVSMNGAFSFPTPVASGAMYSVSVLTNPSGPTQVCTVTAGTDSGTVGSANVTSVGITCATSTFTIGGTLNGLAAGESVVLQNNGADNLTVSANGTFTFATSIASGGTYSVSTLTNPSSPTDQTCVVTMGGGSVTTASITSVVVTCTGNPHTVGGTVSGLHGSGLVLQDNGGDNLPVAANGTFTFATSVASGSAYAVTVLTSPSYPSQTCNVTTGGGNVPNTNVTSVAVNCGCGTGVCAGGDGVLNVTTPTTFSTPVTHLAAAAAAAATTISVVSAAGLKVGDEVLIVNVRSASGNDGVWELAAIQAISGTTLTLQWPLTNAYPEAGNTIVQRVPQYTTATVSSALSGTAWNSANLTGGIVAFAASGPVTVTAAGSITVAGMGYTGGVATNVDPGVTTYKDQGESYVGLGNGSNATDVANAGGGAGGAKRGGCEGSGGGGGGYAAAGSAGGAEQINCFPPGFAGGVGGNAYGNAGLTKIYFGSGGGSGGWSSTLPQGNGGAGGGMVLIFGSSTVTINGSINASGAVGQKESTGAGADYGGGGGGAGGSIYLQSSGVTGIANAVVTGGAGGGVNTAGHIEVGGAGSAGRVTSANAELCSTPNENGTATISCPAGTRISAINFASYGTPNGTCGGFTDGACNGSNSMSVVSAACIGLASCNVPANNATFTDPCYGTGKRLYIDAVCE